LRFLPTREDERLSGLPSTRVGSPRA
jgi:hypothetical protein